MLNYFLLIVLIASAACSFTTKTATENANVNWQNVSDSAATAATTPTPAAAQTPKTAPDALVKDLHKQHDARKSPFFQTKDRALVDKFFDVNLAAMIWKDAKESDGEIGAIDFDPLYFAQDTEIKNLNVGEPKITGEKAEVVVSFNNYEQKQRFTYLLTKQNGDWKISDINYGIDSLVKIFKENEKSTSAAISPTGEFEGKYQIGDTSCTVKPVKMAFEVRWAKGSGVEMFYADTPEGDKFTFSSSNPSGKGAPNVFSFDDENYDGGTFYRADGKEFAIRRIQ